MAKFFSGNYGGQLGSTARAAQLIADAGAREGESLKEIGSMIKSATDKYGEKRRKEEKKLITAGAALAAASKYNPGIVKDIEAGTLGEEAQRALKLINDGNGDEKSADRLLATVGAMNSARALKLEEEQASLLNQARKQQVDFNEATKELRLDNADLSNQVNRLNATILNMRGIVMESNLPAAQQEALLKKMQAEADIRLEPGRQAVEAQKQELGSKQIQGALKALEVFPLEDRAKLQRRAQEGQINANEASTISLLGKAISSLDPQSIQDEAIKKLQTQMKEALSTPSIRVKVGDIRKQVTFEEWEELHKENPKKYPYNASAKQTGSRIAELSLMLQESMKGTGVLAEIPDDTVPTAQEEQEELYRSLYGEKGSPYDYPSGSGSMYDPIDFSHLGQESE